MWYLFQQKVAHTVLRYGNFFVKFFISLLSLGFSGYWQLRFTAKSMKLVCFYTINYCSISLHNFSNIFSIYIYIHYLGVPCDLLTGEDRRFANENGEPAAHIASTVWVNWFRCHLLASFMTNFQRNDESAHARWHDRHWWDPNGTGRNPRICFHKSTSWRCRPWSKPFLHRKFLV